MWKLNTKLLNNQWVKAEIEIKFKKKYPKTNEKGNTAYQDLWNEGRQF